MAYPSHEPMYGWALTAEGVPVPISAAQRGQRYFCPVCKGEMIPKMGDIKQHHFAHLDLLQCSPENVARVVAGRWLVLTLNHYLASKQPVMMTWKAQNESYTVDILKNIAAVKENYPTPEGQADIALLHEAGEAKVVILLGLGKMPDPEQIHQWTRKGTAVIVLNPAGVRSGQMNLETLLSQSEISGGWWLVDEKKSSQMMNLIKEPQLIRRLLRRTVKIPPYRFYRELHTSDGYSHILEIEGQKLWLPPEIWRDVVGGSRNRLGHDVEVILQSWEMQDKGRIVLFYVMVRGTTAIAIRRFQPGESVAFNLGTSAFRLPGITALDLAKHLAGGPINFPA